jgi:hypothetical protein
MSFFAACDARIQEKMDFSKVCEDAYPSAEAGERDTAALLRCAPARRGRRDDKGWVGAFMGN